MKIRISKILFVFLLLLIPPAISSTYDVHAQGDYILVSRSKISLSPEFLLDSHNLNSPEMKRYLIRCMELSEVLPERRIRQIEEELDHVSFFCFKTQLHDDVGNIILNLWVPYDALRPRGRGEFFSFPMRYETTAESDVT